jgi:uncharacterized protein YbgA (DUF1722 family)
MTRREEIDNLVHQIHSWPPEDRVVLATEILHDLHGPTLEPTPRNTLAKARGLLRTDLPPPTDEQVKQWIEEYRVHKYGQR